MDNTEVVRRLFELFARRELDQAVALFSETAEFQVPGSSAISGIYRGRPGVLEFWRRQIDLSAGSFRTRVLSLEPAGDQVVVDVDVSAELNGRPVAWRRAVTYRISGGQIVHATYTEGDQALAAKVFASASGGLLEAQGGTAAALDKCALE
jgi:ketosteroid isomerase-like protein